MSCVTLFLFYLFEIFAAETTSTVSPSILKRMSRSSNSMP